MRRGVGLLSLGSMAPNVHRELFMLKRRAVLACVIGMSGVMGVFVACSDEEPGSTFTPQPGEDASSDTGPGFNLDAAREDQRSPQACKPSMPANFKVDFKVPTKQSVCSDTQLGTYWDACLKPGALSSTDASTPCGAWLAANAECGACIETEDNSGPIQWHRDRLYYTLNVAGCLALERGETDGGANTCAHTYHASVQCQRESCDDCRIESEQDFTVSFQGCQTAAKTTGGCKEYNDKVKPPICENNFGGKDAAAEECFATNADDRRGFFVRVEKIFCGSP